MCYQFNALFVNDACRLFFRCIYLLLLMPVPANRAGSEQPIAKKVKTPASPFGVSRIAKWPILTHETAILGLNPCDTSILSS